MAFFNWAAPAFRRFANRWSDEHIEEMAARLRPFLTGDGAVLDLGGGTGALAQRLADALPADVTVLDPTPEMLAYVPVHPRVRKELGVAERMPFRDDSFDAVVISDAFHHFRDQDGAVREIARVVRSGGALFVFEFDNRGWMKLVVLGERLLGEPAAFFSPSELCAFMSARGIDGECVPTSKATYYFLGRVR